MLKRIRVSLAIFFAISATLLFLDFTGSIHLWLGFVAKIQFLPSFLALNFIIFGAIILLTFLLGRFYCSVICPAGIFQDLVSHLVSKFKKNRFSFSKSKKWFRIGFLILFLLLIICGLNNYAYILDPYSSFGRIISNVFQPILIALNNVCASIAEHYESYAFYEVDVYIKSLPTFIVAIITFAVFVVFPIIGGRTYCNTVCPVGTFLGFISKYSLFKINIDKNKCVGCSICEKNCKASCIDSKTKTIDNSRCVDCMNCIDKCKKGAISFSKVHKVSTEQNKEEETDNSRRAFLTIATTLVASSVVKAQELKVDGGLAIIEDKQIPNRECSIKPAGALSLKHFSEHCTACQLCVSVCPNQVLRPSTDLATFMQPEMSFERGYCRPECTKCSEVCPTGAISKITSEEKSSIHTGHAVWIKKNCIPLTVGDSCGNCAKHCPSGAITMVNSNPEDSNSPKIPSINTELCIGCGACENLCPSRPFSAIYVEGNLVHSQF
ncbi:MAG: 4Fe-4S binding protein [Bacteroidales bacterium]|nr:4Fe-4S binding protein [Bacteroidales bacterium]